MHQALADGGSPSPGSSRTLTAEELLVWRRVLLAEGGRPADLDWLLDLAGGLPWRELQALRLHPGRPVQLRCSQAHIEDLWRRHLAADAPLQYLVGRCPWRDLEVQVAPGVLIPRQETEHLPDLAVDLSRPPAAIPRLWADLGTGSGCLALALALAFPHSRGLTVDVSGAALAQAELNLRAYGALDRVRLIHSHWWQELTPWWGQLDLVVANPPYIPSTTVDGLEPVVRLHEPRLALDGGADGLAAVRQVVAGAPSALAPGGLLLLEHHHDQSQAVLALLDAAGLEEVAAHHDLEGVARFASARRPLATMAPAETPQA
ncbi:peptide chain release factor N(5)-glutamine methyltransferase [Cyanobium sp. FGCU-52]|nr:peptide chain release factor N(5)-glutamine methyltransferase [Cyanobium sp. FGCU52]